LQSAGEVLEIALVMTGMTKCELMISRGSRNRRAAVSLVFRPEAALGRDSRREKA
jgi:hypothetical protein